MQLEVQTPETVRVEKEASVESDDEEVQESLEEEDAPEEQQSLDDNKISKAEYKRG